jgi:hypothetical protein
MNIKKDAAQRHDNRWDLGVLIGIGSGMGAAIGILVAAAAGGAVSLGIAFGATFGAAAGIIVSSVLSDLGLVFPDCPCVSVTSEGCSSVWLPAWLPFPATPGTSRQAVVLARRPSPPSD